MRVANLVLALPIFVASLLSGAGCKKAPETLQTPEASAPEPSAVVSAVPSAIPAPEASAAPPRPAPLRGSGSVGLLFNTVRALELADGEKTKVDEIEAPLREKTASRREEVAEIEKALVEQVKARKIEPQKLEPLYVALEKESSARHELEVTALGSLHAVLDAGKRAALAKEARNRIAEHPKAGAADAGKPAKLPPVPKPGFERLLKPLELDPTQPARAESWVPKEDPSAARDRARSETEALLVAFEKETFDAKKAFPFDAKRVRAPHQEQATFLAQLLTVLPPEQREKLATAFARHGRGPGSHGPGHGKPPRLPKHEGAPDDN
jgi:Spy/CpxP family protein refolding chaperone